MGLSAMTSTTSNTAGIAPASSKSMVQSASGYQCSIAPLSYSFSYAAKDYIDVFCSVIGLLLRCGPSTVIRIITFIVINPINRMRVGWSATHIRKKLLKVVAPLKTDANPIKSVLLISAILRVVASLNHPIPVVKLRRFRHSMSFSKVSGILRPNTATTFSPASPKLITKNGGVFSTFTNAVPARLSVASGFASIKNGKPSECLTSKINHVTHSVSPLVSSPFVLRL